MSLDAILWAEFMALASVALGLAACYQRWKFGDMDDPRDALGAFLFGLMSGTVWLALILSIVTRTGAP